MSELNNLIMDDDDLIAMAASLASAYQRQGSSHEKDLYKTLFQCARKLKALQQSQWVSVEDGIAVSKECAKYAAAVVETYTENQVFTAAQAGKVAQYIAELKGEIKPLPPMKEQEQ